MLRMPCPVNEHAYSNFRKSLHNASTLLEGRSPCPLSRVSLCTPSGMLASPSGLYFPAGCPVSRGEASCRRWRGYEVESSLHSCPVRCPNVTQRSTHPAAVFRVRSLTPTPEAVRGVRNTTTAIEQHPFCIVVCSC